MRLLPACLLLISSTLHASNYGNVTVSEVTSICDADTFHVNIDSWPPIIGERISVRINGIDAPEIKGECEDEVLAARKAKQFTVQALRSANVVELRNIGGVLRTQNPRVALTRNRGSSPPITTMFTPPYYLPDNTHFRVS